MADLVEFETDLVEESEKEFEGAFEEKFDVLCTWMVRELYLYLPTSFHLYCANEKQTWHFDDIIAFYLDVTLFFILMLLLLPILMLMFPCIFIFIGLKTEFLCSLFVVCNFHVKLLTMVIVVIICVARNHVRNFVCLTNLHFSCHCCQICDFKCKLVVSYFSIWMLETKWGVGTWVDVIG